MSDEEGEAPEVGIGTYEGERNEERQRHGQGKWTAGAHVVVARLPAQPASR